MDEGKFGGKETTTKAQDKRKETAKERVKANKDATKEMAKATAALRAMAAASKEKQKRKATVQRHATDVGHWAQIWKVQVPQGSADGIENAENEEQNCGGFQARRGLDNGKSHKLARRPEAQKAPGRQRPPVGLICRSGASQPHTFHYGTRKIQEFGPHRILQWELLVENSGLPESGLLLRPIAKLRFTAAKQVSIQTASNKNRGTRPAKSSRLLGDSSADYQAKP